MNKIKSILKYIFLSISAFVSIFPFFWMIIGATNQSKDVIKGKLTLGTHFGENMYNVFATTYIGKAIVNTIIITIITTLLSVLICSMAGYGFDVYKSKKKDNVFSILLLSMMLPFAALMIPLYRIFGYFNLLNSFIAVILPSIATAFLIFFFRQNSKLFPRELIEAARVDGLNEWQIFTKIYFPSMKSTYAAAGIITFMSAWNNYIWPLLVLQTPEKMTLPLVISTLNSSYNPDYGMIMVAIVIATLPTALVFFLMQRHFVEGMVGSVK